MKTSGRHTQYFPTLKACILGMAAVAITLPSSCLAQRFLAAKVSVKVRFQAHNTVNTSDNSSVELAVIKGGSGNNNVLINNALGRDGKATVPANLVLAVEVCNDAPALVVFDKNTGDIALDPDSSAPLIIGTFSRQEEDQVKNEKLDSSCPDQTVRTGSEILATLTFAQIGKFQGGEIQLHLKTVDEKIPESDCDTCTKSISGSGAGSIDVLTGDEPPSDVVKHLLVPSFTISASKKLSP